MIKISIIGVGAIGYELARYCVNPLKEEVRLIGVLDKNKVREKKACREFGLEKPVSVKAAPREIYGSRRRRDVSETSPRVLPGRRSQVG